MTYKIVRFFFSDEVGPKVLERGLTLEEAQARCNDPETSSSPELWAEIVKRLALEVK